MDVKGGYIEKWGYRLIMYIFYYTVYFFVIYAYFELLIKQKKKVQRLSVHVVVYRILCHSKISKRRFKILIF